MSETYANIDTARRAAVSKAWAQERELVKEGKGTRDWSKSQQAEILATGKCKGFEGHHKFSVKENPELAGEKDNIQFLNKSEHLKAHENNFKTDPKGRYDSETGKLEKYQNGKVKAEPVRNLSNKMAEGRKESSLKKYEETKNIKQAEMKRKAAEKAKNFEKQNVQKQTLVQKNTKSQKTSAREHTTKTSQSLHASRSHTASPSAKPGSRVRTSKALSRSQAAHQSGERSASVSHSTGKGNTGSPAGGRASAGKGVSTGGHGSSSGGHGGSSGGHGGHGR